MKRTGLSPAKFKVILNKFFLGTRYILSRKYKLMSLLQRIKKTYDKFT